MDMMLHFMGLVIDPEEVAMSYWCSASRTSEKLGRIAFAATPHLVELRTVLRGPKLLGCPLDGLSIVPFRASR
jgi:hypothetical protein